MKHLKGNYKRGTGKNSKSHSRSQSNQDSLEDDRLSKKDSLESVKESKSKSNPEEEDNSESLIYSQPEKLEKEIGVQENLNNASLRKGPGKKGKNHSRSPSEVASKPQDGDISNDNLYAPLETAKVPVNESLSRDLRDNSKKAKVTDGVASKKVEIYSKSNSKENSG